MLAQQCMYFEKHLLTIKQPCFIILHCWYLLLKERENSSLDASKKKKNTKLSVPNLVIRFAIVLPLS